MYVKTELMNYEHDTKMQLLFSQASSAAEAEAFLLLSPPSELSRRRRRRHVQAAELAVDVGDRVRDAEAGQDP